MRQPDIDLCRECGEHTSFDEEGLSECCGAKPYDTDPDIDMERRYTRLAVMIFSVVAIGCGDQKSPMESDQFLPDDFWSFDLSEVSLHEKMIEANYVYIPGGWDVDGDGVIEPGFYIQKYEARNSGNGTISTPSGLPRTNINHVEARERCASTSMHPDYELDVPTVVQYTQIAQLIANNPSNWVSGVAGQGSLIKGHSDGVPYNKLSASPGNPYFGTGNGTGNQRRTFNIQTGISVRTGSGGSYTISESFEDGVLWDIAGNVWEHTRDLKHKSTICYSNTLDWFEVNETCLPEWMHPILADGTELNSSHSTGMYYNGNRELGGWDINRHYTHEYLSAITGGHYGFKETGGIFTHDVYVGESGVSATAGGFRCATK